MVSRHVHSAILGAVLLLAACTDGSRPPTTVGVPNAPSPVASPPTSATPAVAAWSADTTVLSVTGPGRACGWGTLPGETRMGVAWRVTIADGSILLEEDMSNWPTDHNPYSGKLTGRQFAGEFSMGADYLRYVCQFKGATIVGSFSEDFSTFEAVATLVWGPPGGETTVMRRSVGTRFSPR